MDWLADSLKFKLWQNCYKLGPTGHQSWCGWLLTRDKELNPCLVEHSWEGPGPQPGGQDQGHHWPQHTLARLDCSHPAGWSDQYLLAAEKSSTYSITGKIQHWETLKSSMTTSKTNPTAPRLVMSSVLVQNHSQKHTEGIHRSCWHHQFLSIVK